MTTRSIGLLAAAAFTLGLPAVAQAAEWEEILVTVGHTHAVEMAEGRKVISYFGTGAYAMRAGGGTGKWLGFSAACTYEVHRQASGHAIEFGHCVGDALPPPLLN